MPSGAALGLVVALTPADKPTRAIVVAAPGGAGVDAAAIAAEVGAGIFSPRANRSVTDAAHSAIGNGPDPLIRLGRTLANGSTRVETLESRRLHRAGAGRRRAAAGRRCGAAGARDHRADVRARQSQSPSPRRLRSLRHHALPGACRPATAITRRAAESTSGRVLLHQGQPAFVFYSAWCGGKSELASQVWPGAIDYSYEPALHDEACEDEPGWDERGARRAISSARCGRPGLRGSRLRNLRVLSRNTSDRVARIAVEGFTPAEISGHEFRMAVGRVAGWQSIKSTAFDIDRTSSGYRFKGRGFGHGVGLCVIGAGRRAAKGATADEILKFYFPGPHGRHRRHPPTTTTTAAPAPPPRKVAGAGGRAMSRWRCPAPKRASGRRCCR